MLIFVNLLLQLLQIWVICIDLYPFVIWIIFLRLIDNLLSHFLVKFIANIVYDHNVMVCVLFVCLNFLLDIIFHLRNWFCWKNVHFSFHLFLKLILRVSKNFANFQKLSVFFTVKAGLLPKLNTLGFVYNVLNNEFSKTNWV